MSALCCDTPLRAYIALRCQLNRAIDHADGGDWEESLAAVDEARRTLAKLERFSRSKGAPKRPEADSKSQEKAKC